MNNTHPAFRVETYLGKRWDFVSQLFNTHVSDPRDNRGKRHHLLPLLQLTFAGLLSQRNALRDLELMTNEISFHDPLQKSGRSGRISDSVFYELWPRLEAAQFLPIMVAQVKDMHRRGELSPQLLPCGVLTFDGKSLGKISHDADGMAAEISSDDLEPAYHARVIRATLTSSKGKIIIGQEPILAHEGEISALPRAIDWACHSYAPLGLFNIIDVDAGLLSKNIFSYVDRVVKAKFFAALKGNQPNLLELARKTLIPKLRSAPPEFSSSWENYQGAQVRRNLYRTTTLDGSLGWKNFRQVIMVAQEERIKVAITPDEQKALLIEQERREKRSRPSVRVSKLLELPVLEPDQDPKSIPVLAKLLALLNSSEATDTKPVASVDRRKSKKRSKLRASAKAPSKRRNKTASSLRRARKLVGRKSKVRKASPKPVDPQITFQFAVKSKTPSCTPENTTPHPNRSAVNPVVATSSEQNSTVPQSSNSDSTNLEFDKDREDIIEKLVITSDGYLVSTVLRFFITKIEYSYLTSSQLLLFVRNHWAIENNSFHSLDVQWKEDSPAWSTAGKALFSLGMLRILAYNYVQQLRNNHVQVFRQKQMTGPPAEAAQLDQLLSPLTSGG